MSETTYNGGNEAVHQAGETAAKAAEAQQEAAEKTANAVYEGLDFAVPEAVRSLAERTVTQSREAYETAKGSVEETIGAMEKSIDKAGQGAAKFNRKVIDITQANVNSGFDLAKNIAGAKNVAEIMELQADFARRQFETFTAQAEELRSLSAEVAADASAPVKDHVSRSFQKATER